MPLRDHDPIIIESFGGWWQRGDPESCPSDCFTVADNIQYFTSGFETRDPLDKYQSIPGLDTVLRIYNYVTQDGQTILALTIGGAIFHLVGTNIIYGPILTIPEMEDFGFVAINGRAYITPFKSYVNSQGQNYELGLHNEFLYVYKGDGTPARKAGGLPPTGAPMVVANGAAGLTDIGKHLFAVVYETDTGYQTALGPGQFTLFDMDGLHKLNISTIPVSGSPFVKRRLLVSTKTIATYNNDQTGFQFFFIPGGNIDDNTTTTKTVEFFDADLLNDASHLIDNFSEIPSGVGLNTYHSRLVIVGEFGTDETLIGLPPGITDNRSIARLSAPGEPEAISKIDGLIIAPLDGNPLTTAQEFRDILYLFKKTRTFGYSDNQDVPASWQEEVIDQGVGSPVHGVATVLDSGGVNVDFLLIADMSGLMLFNGVYTRPELSWKIEDYWQAFDRNKFRQVQIVNDSLTKKIWLTTPDPLQHVILHANYGDGLDAKNIKWARWIFDAKMGTITLTEANKLVMGAIGTSGI